MKNKIAALLVPAILMGGATAYAGQVSWGAKAWLNDFETETKFGSSSSDSVLMLGPSIKYTEGSFFVGGSYMLALSDYEFDNGSTVERSDVDLIVGYKLSPRFSVYGGYKIIDTSEPFSDSYPSDFSPSDPGTITLSGVFDSKFSGLGLGIMGNKPINERTVLFGSIGIMNLTNKWTESWTETDDSYPPPNSLSGSEGGSEDFDGTAFEIGLAVGLSANMSATFSYKAQSLSHDSGVDLNFSGLAVSFDMAL